MNLEKENIPQNSSAKQIWIKSSIWDVTRFHFIDRIYQIPIRFYQIKKFGWTTNHLYYFFEVTLLIFLARFFISKKHLLFTVFLATAIKELFGYVLRERKSLSNDRISFWLFLFFVVSFLPVTLKFVFWVQSFYIRTLKIELKNENWRKFKYFSFVYQLKKKTQLLLQAS